MWIVVPRTFMCRPVHTPLGCPGSSIGFIPIFCISSQTFLASLGERGMFGLWLLFNQRLNKSLSFRMSSSVRPSFGAFLNNPLHSFHMHPAFLPSAPNALPTPHPAAEHAAFLAISFPVSFMNWCVS